MIQTLLVRTFTPHHLNSISHTVSLDAQNRTREISAQQQSTYHLASKSCGESSEPMYRTETIGAAAGRAAARAATLARATANLKKTSLWVNIQRVQGWLSTGSTLTTIEVIFWQAQRVSRYPRGTETKLCRETRQTRGNKKISPIQKVRPAHEVVGASS